MLGGFKQPWKFTPIIADIKQTRPVWMGFKIAVRPKLLTHYYKVSCLDTIIICNSYNKNNNWEIKNVYYKVSNK